MNFPTITIPDPASVGKWLDEEVPQICPHRPSFGVEWSVFHWHGSEHFIATSDTPEALLADIRRQLAENDPLAKLRKEWIAAGRPDLNADVDARIPASRDSESITD